MASKVLFGLAVLSAFCVVSWSKPANMAGVRIYSDGRFLHCDTLICPEATEKCKVTGKTSDIDSRMIETWRRCLDRHGTVLAEDKKMDNNPNPNEAYEVDVESDRDGNARSSSSSSSGSGGYYFPPRTTVTQRNGASTLQWLFGLYISMFIFLLNKC